MMSAKKPVSAIAAFALGLASLPSVGLGAPSAATPSWLAVSRTFVGRPCGQYIGAGVTMPGYDPIPGFVPVVLPGHYVLTQQRHGARFAFLFKMADDNLDSCVVTDVVAMPPPAKAEALLVCGLGDDAPASNVGVALRQNGAKVPAAYWQVTGDKLVLRPGVTPKCRFPEYGE